MFVLADVVVIFLLRVVGISVSTLATILMVQGRRFPAILTGSLSALVYVLAIGKVVTNLENVWNIAAYVIGFGAGTWVGMVIEGRMALGFAEVRIISAERGQELVDALREAGYGVTQLFGRGRQMTVSVIEVITLRKNMRTVLEIVDRLDDRAIVSVSEARTVQRGYWPKPDRRR